MKLKITLLLSCLALSACVGLPTKTQPPKLMVNDKGVPSHYKVQKGDTVSGIAKRYGLNWREVASLNNLDGKYTIHQGQWLMLWQGKGENVAKATTPVVQPLIVQQSPKVVMPTPQPVAVPVVEAQPKFVSPVPRGSTIVRPFGATSGSNIQSQGVWFRSEYNEPIVAIADGRVIFIDESSANGIFVNIRHADGLVSEYRFVKNLKVEPNQLVKMGQQIASTRKTSSGSVITEFRLSKHGSYIDPMTVLSP